MRIAFLGSVAAPIPPLGQAAIERLVADLALGLAERGHEILLFALAESKLSHPRLKLVEVGREATRQAAAAGESVSGPELSFGASYKLRLEMVHLASVIAELEQRVAEYDVILNHLRGEAVLLPVVYRLGKPFFHVLHLPIFPELAELFSRYQTKLIALSEAQKRGYPNLSYSATIPNGVNLAEFPFSAKPGDYVLYLGSIGRNKNPKDAILAAKQAGVPIKIGGLIKDRAYFETEVKPLLSKGVEWLGEVDRAYVISLYQGARALLFPTLWEEPFGLVMIEAMACGTPVVAYPHGAVPEVVVDGQNGYLAHDSSQMAEKILAIERINRENCRRTVEERFTIERMVAAYEKTLGSVKYDT